ncbi:hypothetical protein [Flavobacterium pedocola]
MKILKPLAGILFSALYALIIRYAAAFGYIDINSSSYLIIAPMVMSFIPFFLNDETFLKSILKCICYPLLAVVLFLVIAVISRIEELLCFIIIGLPYVLISVFTSLGLRQIMKNRKKNRLQANLLPLLLLPFLSHAVENHIGKQTIEHKTESTIIINTDNETIWRHLHAVPNLSKFTRTSFINSIGIPKPIHSEYDPVKNIRLGYFDNGIILHEKVVEEQHGKKLSFSIDMQKSTIVNSPTLENVIKEESIQFDKITYELTRISSKTTAVKLTCNYRLKTNLTNYTKFIAGKILLDFEENLLNALKNNLENLPS